MALRVPAPMPEPTERGVQGQPPALLLPSACLTGQALGLGRAPALTLAVMGQLSECFVVQHCHPSLPRVFG